MREKFDFTGTPIKFSFRDEKQIKANREKAAEEAKKAATPRKTNSDEVLEDEYQL